MTNTPANLDTLAEGRKGARQSDTARAGRRTGGPCRGDRRWHRTRVRAARCAAGRARALRTRSGWLRPYPGPRCSWMRSARRDRGNRSGDRAGGTGEVVRVPVGPALLGRIVDPLGRPLDGGGTINAESHEPVERPAPAIIDRDFVSEPVQTGLLVIDSMFALGRGQRELIIGDRAIGKTAIAVDCIINQKTSDIICVYVAVGQKSSTVKRVINAIQAHGAPERCIFVVASASAAPGSAMDRALCRLHDGGIFSRSRPARSRRHRRHDQARRHASRNRASHAAAAGARGLSR